MNESYKRSLLKTLTGG